jgi:Zn-finger nucleic acid-binding protein
MKAAAERKYSRFDDRPEDCPKCLRNLPHTREEHEAALRRNDQASDPDCELDPANEFSILDSMVELEPPSEEDLDQLYVTDGEEFHPVDSLEDASKKYRSMIEFYETTYGGVPPNNISVELVNGHGTIGYIAQNGKIFSGSHHSPDSDCLYPLTDVLHNCPQCHKDMSVKMVKYIEWEYPKKNFKPTCPECGTILERVAINDIINKIRKEMGNIPRPLTAEGKKKLYELDDQWKEIYSNFSDRVHEQFNKEE